MTLVQPERVGPLAALRQGRRLLGFPPIQSVLCYAVDGLLIDTGLACHAEATCRWARSQRAGQAVVTHHHEDHSGGAAGLGRAGLVVWASAQAVQVLAGGFRLPFYRRAVWGPAPPPWLTRPLGPSLETEHHRLTVVSAPGHSSDQVALHEPRQGWLFAADAFLSRTLRYLRPEEDFQAHLETLGRLVALDFEHLFCAHRPVLGGGREALRQKLDFWQDLAGRVRELAGRGWPVGRIVRATLGPENQVMAWLTWGDVTKANLVRSILKARPQAHE